ncbi:GRAM domain-containing protein 2B-like isoform X2 [Littorina saxatilis]|uniref:GRAM domain-containing protein 2B-like isoform X2 n=1 Tax=Littorina saxatilis TaxID=31220 RepID=UPI0038B64E44
MRKRAASGGDVLLKPRSLSLVPTTTTNSSSSTKPSKANPPREKYSHLKASSPVGERLDRSKDWERSSSPRHDVVPVTKNESPSLEKDRDSGDRDRDHPGEGTSKQKRKSVCVVPPSDVHAMRLTRSNSEKLPPEEGEAIHDAVAPRRSAGPALSQSRKSMPSLSVAFDQQLLLDTENGGDLGDAGHRELRKSGGSGASTSGSNGGEIITTQIDSSSPKLPSSEYKKIVEYSDLPPHVSKSKNAKFHKLFKSVPLEEYPIDSYSCAFKGDILIHGMLYVSQNWICFYSKIRARGRLLEIPLEKVISITREKLALIIPNAIGIQIADQKYVFGSFMSRDNTYKLLVTLWKHSQDSATKAGRRALVNGSRIEDDMTHSADVSGESDTTEDEDMGVPTDPSLLMDPSLSSMASRTSDGGGRDSRNDQQPDKVPGLFLLRCIDCRKMFVALSNFAVKIQKAPRTNLLLAICSILVVFLLLSAMGLTYKILLLQTRLEMSHLWTPGRQHSFREQTLGSIYTLQSQTHMATIHQLHDVLKANIQILQQVHQSLKSLQVYTASEDCPTAK